MAKIKIRLIDTGYSWRLNGRYKVNEVVDYLGNSYQNITGKNSSPDSLIDWVKTNIPILSNKPAPVSLTAIVAGANQVFTLPLGYKPYTVYVSNGIIYKGTQWTFSGNQLTIIKNINAGNTIYIEHE